MRSKKSKGMAFCAAAILCLMIIFSSFSLGASGLSSGEEEIGSAENPTPDGLADSAWPTFRGNRRNTGLSPYETGHLDNAARWTFDTDDKIQSSPALDEHGLVYIGSRDGNLYAVNQDGREEWSFNTGDLVTSSPTVSDNGLVYIGSRDGNLYAVNQDGREEWSFSTGFWIESSPAVAEDGTIYVASYDGNLYALDQDGNEKWSYELGGDPFSSPAIGPNGAVYIGSDNGNLYAVEEDGSEKWTSPIGDFVRSSPAVSSDGTVYVGSGSGSLYALDSDGSERWSFDTGDEISSSPAIGPNGTIYIGSDNGNLYAVEEDGSEKWSTPLGGFVRSSPAVSSDGIVYVGSGSGSLYAINPDGSERWSFDTGDEIWSSPAIGEDGSIYFGSNDEKLYALGTEQEVELTIDSSDGGDVVEPGEGTYSYSYGSTVELEAKAYKDHHFSRWSGDTGSIENPEERITTIEMDGNKEITAEFAVDTYELNITVDGEGSTEPSEGIHEHDSGENVTVNAVPEEEWSFTRWTGDVPKEEGEEPEITITMDQDKEITAHFEEDDEGNESEGEEWNLTIEVQGEGTTDPEPGTYTYDDGKNVTVQALSTEEGWTFSHWEGDVAEEVERNEDITVIMDQDKKITAHFADEKARFEIEILSPQVGDEYEKGDDIILEFRVENTGDIQSELDVEFYVGGELVETKESIVLAPHETHEGHFVYEVEDDGELLLEVKGLQNGSEGSSKEVMVVVEDGGLSSYTWYTWVLLATIAGVIIAALAAVLWIKGSKGEEKEERTFDETRRPYSGEFPTAERPQENQQDERTSSFPKSPEYQHEDRYRKKR
ncbi:MAG: PQQ-binding-like beta-propeller repeat protein [Candidatus Natronoplasma sp.]